MQTRQEFWGQQKPLYARKIQRKMAEGKTTVDEEDEQLRRRIDEKKSRVQANHETVTRLLVDIDAALQRAEYERALQMCAEAEHTIKSYSLTWLPRRQAYLGVVYSALGDAHLKLGHYREALKWHNKDLELSKDNPRLLHSRARALDNLGRTHATFRRYQAAIDAWEQRIPLSRSPEKRTWLFHEIGTCYRELGRHETARFYGTKCVKEARRCEQHGWVMRGLWLLAEAETQLEVMDAALKHFDQAIELASTHGTKQEMKALEAACQRAVELMKQRELDRAKAKALYTTVGVIQPRRSVGGNVTFDEPDEWEEEAQERAPRPNIVLTEGADESGSVIDISDSFDDTGSYIDWTDEDTLPPEEPSQEQLAAAPDDEDGDGEDGDSSSGAESSPRSSGEEAAAKESGREAEAPADGQTTPVPSGEPGETEYETTGGETTAPEDGEQATAGETTDGEDGGETTEAGDDTDAGETADAGETTADTAATGEEGETEEGGEETQADGEDTEAATEEGGDTEAAPETEGEGETAATDEPASEAEAPAEEATAEDATEDAPAEEGATEEAPAEEAPAEEAPAEEAPAEEAPAEEAPAEETPAEAPADEGTGEEAPAEEAPAEAPADDAEGGEAEAPADAEGAEEAPAEPAEDADAPPAE